MILDADFFQWLEDRAHSIREREKESLNHLVHRSAELKASVVERDEREITGLRACLNYGHTFAHAFETTAGYGTLLHGEAVSLGMMAAVRLACSLDLLDQTVVERQQKLLKTLGLPIVTTVLNDIAPDDFLKIMARDKKTVGGNLRFVLPDKIGHVEIIDRIDQMLVTSAIKTVCHTN